MKNHGKKSKTPSAARQHLPSGWDEERVHRVAAHYENQTEDEAVAEDEAAYEAQGQTVMIVPNELVPAIRKLLARRQRA
jgi:cytochrome c553